MLFSPPPNLAPNSEINLSLYRSSLEKFWCNEGRRQAHLLLLFSPHRGGRALAFRRSCIDSLLKVSAFVVISIDGSYPR